MRARSDLPPSIGPRGPAQEGLVPARRMPAARPGGPRSPLPGPARLCRSGARPPPAGAQSRHLPPVAGSGMHPLVVPAGATTTAIFPAAKPCPDGPALPAARAWPARLRGWRPAKMRSDTGAITAARPPARPPGPGSRAAAQGPPASASPLPSSCRQILRGSRPPGRRGQRPRTAAGPAPPVRGRHRTGRARDGRHRPHPASVPRLPPPRLRGRDRPESARRARPPRPGPSPPPRRCPRPPSRPARPPPR